MRTLYGKRLWAWFTSKDSPMQHGVIFDQVDVTEEELILHIPEVDSTRYRFGEPRALVGILLDAVRSKHFGRMEESLNYFEMKEIRFRRNELMELLKEDSP